MMISIERLPTSTATPIRLCAYQPTRRPTQTIREVETVYGSLTIDGRLGQAHADLMDCVMYLAEKHRVKDDHLEVVVDPYRIRKVLGCGGQYSADQMAKLQRDLLQTILTIDTPMLKISGHIIDQFIKTKQLRIDRRSWSSGQRHLQVWVFSQQWTLLMKQDISRYYNPIPLCRIDSGSVAAIARHILTHQSQPNGGWRLDGLIRATGVTRQLSKVRTELIENADALTELGIQFCDDRLSIATPARLISLPARQFDRFSHTRPEK